MDESSVSDVGFKALSNLQHFKEFYFMQGAFEPHETVYYKKLFWLCMKHLPKLRYLGDHCSLDNAMHYNCLGKLTTKWLLEVGKPTTLALQDMTLYEASCIPDGVFLPNLTSLNLLEPRDNFQCDQKLTTVTELSIYDGTKEVCYRILEQLGEQLKKIRVFPLQDSIPMDQILNLCPNLNLLSYIGPEQITLASNINPDTLRQLTVLDMYYWPSADLGYSYGPEALLQLLQAPELRILRLHLNSVDQKEVDEIVRQLQQGEILQKLELAALWPPRTNDKACYELATIQIKCLQSNMVLHCPKMNLALEEIDLYKRDED